MNNKEYNNKHKSKIGKIIKKTAIIILAVYTGAGITVNLINPIHHKNNDSEPKKPTYSYTQMVDNNILKHNELGTISDEKPSIPISFQDYSYMNMTDTLDKNPVEFKASEYFALDIALNQYYNTVTNSNQNYDLLNENGQIDSKKLYNQVLENNEKAIVNGKNTLNLLYKDLDNGKIREFCDLVAKVVNSNADKMPTKDVANILTKLTMFKRTGSTSNAYISQDVTLVYNPNSSNLYDRMKNDNDKVSIEEEVLTHEIMHLIQYGSNDKNNDNGIESGFNRMYNNNDKKIPVDSLWYSWSLEASAELGMSKSLNIKPGTYQKKISYVNSFNLSRFNEIESPNQSLENAVFSRNLEEAFKNLNLITDKEKQDFLKFMYSVEITQYDTKDFWEYYESQTNTNLNSEEKVELKKEIRTSAVKYMTNTFFNNITNALHEGKINDLNTVFYLLRIWEMDTYNHINSEYEEINNNGKEELRSFVTWYNDTQNQLLSNIATNNNITLDDIKTMYKDYTIFVKSEDGTIKDNCDLSKFNGYMQHYIKDIKGGYTYASFKRISDIAQQVQAPKNTK